MDTDAILKFAAIDIGSNALRLLLAGVITDGPRTTFHKVSLIRMPVRLGQQAFTRGRLSRGKQAQLMQTMIGFQHLLEAYQPLDVMACATAALRSLNNGELLCERIRRQTGIKIDLIDGKREAQIMLENSRAAMVAGIQEALFVDVGGGSTELTLRVEGRKDLLLEFFGKPVSIEFGQFRRVDQMNPLFFQFDQQLVDALQFDPVQVGHAVVDGGQLLLSGGRRGGGMRMI